MPNFLSRLFSRGHVAADAAPPFPSPPPGRFALDGLTNYLTGMGSSDDPAEHDVYLLPEGGVDRTTADAIYRSDWLGKRVVTTIADDMTREWRDVLWDGSRDDDGVFDVKREEDRLQVPKRILSALKWARHYGGSIVVMVIKGQIQREAMREPLDVTKIKKGDLLNLLVYDRWRVYGTPPEKRDYSNPDIVVPYLNQTFDDPNFGQPGMYYLADSSLGIHHSRCIRFDGNELPWTEWARNGMWHDSVYQVLMRAIKSYSSLMAGCSAIVRKANIDVFASEGLADLVSTNAGTTQAKARYHLLSLMMSMYGIAVIDKDQETFERKPAQFAGLRDLCDRFALDVAGAADVPLTRLFGQSPGGLNATGESDLQNYDNHIAARQRSNLTPQMYQLDRVLVRSALGHMPDDYRFTWNPLRAMSAKDKSAIQFQNAQRDDIYLTQEVVQPEHVGRELRADGVYPNLTEEDVDVAKQVGEVVTPPEAGTAKGGNGKKPGALAVPVVPGEGEEAEEEEPAEAS